MLTYSVALGDPSVQSPKKAEVSGWILKKKRKRMQGWAKRWFTLSPSGLLSYSTSQNGITRGSIQILVSTISYNAKLRQLHIDSGTMIYHLKALTEQEYESWSSALREFRAATDNDTEVEQESEMPMDNKRISRSINSSHQIDKRLKAQVEQGVQLSSQLQGISAQLMEKVMDLRQFLPPQAQALMDQIEREKRLLLSNTDDQLFQWQSVQAYLSNHRRSGGTASPISPHITDIEEQEPQKYRTVSVHSRMSGYSDQFFDAEDIVLSDEEDHENIIINNESSDEESGENGKKKKKKKT
jgi:hypothetical protein